MQTILEETRLWYSNLSQALRFLQVKAALLMLVSVTLASFAIGGNGDSFLVYLCFVGFSFFAYTLWPVSYVLPIAPRKAYEELAGKPIEEVNLQILSNVIDAGERLGRLYARRERSFHGGLGMLLVTMLAMLFGLAF